MKYTSVSIGGVTLGDPRSVDYQTATFAGTKRVDQPAPSCEVRFELDPDEAARLGSFMRATVVRDGPPPIDVMLDGRQIGSTSDFRDGPEGVMFDVEPTAELRAQMMIAEMGESAAMAVARFACDDLSALFALVP